MFIFYSILIIFSIVSLLMVCFCPNLVFSILSSLFKHIIKFAALIFSLTYKGLQFISNSIISAYQSRQNQNGDIINNKVQMPNTPIVHSPAAEPFLPTGLVASAAFIDQSSAFIDQSAAFYDQFSITAPPTTDRANSNDHQVTKMLRFQPGTLNTLEASAPFQPAHPRTPTFQRMFRRN